MMRCITSLTFLVWFSLGLISLKSGKSYENKIIFERETDLLRTYEGLIKVAIQNGHFNTETNKLENLEKFKGLTDEEVISSIFERFSIFKVQVNFLTCRAYCQLVSNKEKNTNIYEGCFKYSQFIKLYNSQFPVRWVYDMKPIKGSSEAVFKIENVIENTEKLFAKLKKMEQAFENAKGYENLFKELNKVGKFSLDKMEIRELTTSKEEKGQTSEEKKKTTASSHNNLKVEKQIIEEMQEKIAQITSKEKNNQDTRTLLLQRFFEFFEEEILNVENYWNNFLGSGKTLKTHDELTGDPETVDRRFRMTQAISEETTADFNKFDLDSVLTILLTEVFFYNAILGKKTNLNTFVQNEWKVMKPENNKMDFLYKWISIIDKNPRNNIPTINIKDELPDRKKKPAEAYIDDDDFLEDDDDEDYEDDDDDDDDDEGDQDKTLKKP